MAIRESLTSRIYMCLDAVHTRAYKRTGYYIRSLTIILGLGSEVNLLGDEVAGSALLKEKLDVFFRKEYRPEATDPDLFLPENFTPEAILMASENLRTGKMPSTEPEKYLDQHTGILILEVSDIYYYRPENSWVAQVWIIDTDHLDNIGIDFYIRNGEADRYIEDACKYENLILPDDEYVTRADKNGVTYDPDGVPVYREPYEKVTFKKNIEYGQ